MKGLTIFKDAICHKVCYFYVLNLYQGTMDSSLQSDEGDVTCFRSLHLQDGRH